MERIGIITWGAGRGEAHPFAVAVILLCLLMAGAPQSEALAQEERPSLDVPQIPETRDDLQAAVAESYALRPAKREVSQERIDQLNLPEGFAIDLFAQDLENPRILAVHDDGTVYVSERDSARVRMLQDTTGDGSADESMVVASDLEEVHGLAIHDGQLYMVGIHNLWRASIQEDGSLGEPELLRDDLPNAGQHPNRTLGFSPDGALFLSIGSTTNANPEEEEKIATLVRGQEDGAEMEIYAEGLRNTIGFAWHPTTGELWGLDHGSDGRGNDVPPEELNRIEEGNHYGWPFCYGEQEPDMLLVAEPEGMTKQEFCRTTEPMMLSYQAHSAPMQLAFYTEEAFPEEYRNDAFATMRGSWNRNPAVGYEVVRIQFDENSEPQAFEPFISGWLVEDGQAHFGRLCGLAVAADGSLLITDDENGAIYRVWYEGEE